MSRDDKIELSEFTYKKKNAQQTKGNVHHIEILRALPAEKTVTLTEARK